MYIQSFAMVEDWPEIERLMEVSTMFYIGGSVFLLGRTVLSYKTES